MSETELVIVGADGTPVGEEPPCRRRSGCCRCATRCRFPDMVIPLAVGQERSLRLVDEVLTGDRRFVMVAGRDPEVEQPSPEQLYEVGVIGTIARMMKVPDGTSRLLVQGGQRVRITVDPARALPRRHDRGDPDVLHESDELTALVREVQRTFLQIVEQVPYLPEELQLAVANIDGASQLATSSAAPCASPPRRSRSSSSSRTWSCGSGGCTSSLPASSTSSRSGAASTIRCRASSTRAARVRAAPAAARDPGGAR